MNSETKKNEFWTSFNLFHCRREREFTKLLWYVHSKELRV